MKNLVQSSGGSIAEKKAAACLMNGIDCETVKLEIPIWEDLGAGIQTWSQVWPTEGSVLNQAVQGTVARPLH